MPTDTTTDSIERRLARLEAIEEIRALKMRYARWCDAGFGDDGLDAIFTPDCTWDGGAVFGRHVGHDGLKAFFAGARASVAWTLHYIVSGAIEVADDVRSARSTWYLWQPLTLDGRAVWNMGRYDEQHVLTDHGWRISSLELTVDALTGVDRGWVEERFLSRGGDAA